MANQRLVDMTAASALDGTEVVYGVQSSDNVKITTQAIADLASGGSGDVVGPASATDNAIARYDGTTGKLIQNSGATIDDTGIITGASYIGAGLKADSSAGLLLESNSGTDVALLGAGGGSGATFYGGVNIGGNLTVDTNVLHVDTTNNRVGVNTASPAVAFDVVATGSAQVFNVTNAAGSFTFGVDSLGGYAQAQTANKGVYFYNTVGTSNFGVVGTGGIEFNAPTAKTHVFNVNSSAIATISGTGIAVTGKVNTSTAGTSAGDVATIDGTQTLTNKTLIATSNVVEEITTTASSGTPTPTGGSLRNFFTITALATAPTFAAPSGSPADGNYLTIRIKDDGTARALAWNAIYRAGTDVALPTTTVLGKEMYIGFRYNSGASKWDLLAVANGF